MSLHRSRLTVLAIALSLGAHDARAQQASPNSIVDSADAARRHFAAARTALRENDLSRAQQSLEHAATAWPLQPAYVVYVASIAARRGDAVVTTRALTRLAQLEAGAELLPDTTLRALSQRDAAVRVAYERWQNALVPVEASRLHAELNDSTVFPEGVAYDADTRVTYVTSIRHRTIVARHADGSEREIVPRGAAHMGAMMAVRVDPDRQHLWATFVGLPSMHGYTPADSTMAALVRIRIADGAQVGRWTFGEQRPHAPGDIALAPNGDVYVSDSRSPLLYRLRKGATQLDSVTHPLFRSLQGMAITPDGRTMYLADYSHGLLRVDLATHAVQPVTHADSISTLGLDGIALHGSSVVAVQNGVSPARIVRYTLSTTGHAITTARTIDRRPTLADEPTNGVIIGNDFVYIANSQWEKYDAAGQRVPSQQLTRPRLLRVPLDR